MKIRIVLIILALAVATILQGCGTTKTTRTDFYQDPPISDKDAWGYQQNGKAFHEFVETYGNSKIFDVYYHRQRRWSSWDPYDPKVAYNTHKFDRVKINRMNGWGDIFFEVDKFSKTLIYDISKQMHSLPVDSHLR